MLKVKKGDTRHAIKATLKRSGQAVNLTGCTVLIFISNGVSGHTQYFDAEKGKVFFPLEENVVKIADVYYYEFRVIYPDGRKESFPNNGYLKLRIVDSLEV